MTASEGSHGWEVLSDSRFVELFDFGSGVLLASPCAASRSRICFFQESVPSQSFLVPLQRNHAVQVRTGTSVVGPSERASSDALEMGAEAATSTT